MGILQKLLVAVAGVTLTASSITRTDSVGAIAETHVARSRRVSRRGLHHVSARSRSDHRQHARQTSPLDNAIQRADLVESRHHPNQIISTQPDDFVFGVNPSAMPWRFWGSAEVLLGMSRPVPVVPIVTTGPATAGVLNAGAIGQPGTVPLFGGAHMLGDWRGGLRAEGGLWFDSPQNSGVTARFYSLYSTSDQLIGAGNGLNVVNVPQFISVGGLIVRIPAPVGFPGLTTGTVSTTAQTMFAGGDLNLRRMLRQGSRWRVDALVGYRQLTCTTNSVRTSPWLGQCRLRSLPSYRVATTSERKISSTGRTSA